MAKNTSILLDASRKLQELSPGSAAFADRLAYLRLILGVEMETVNLSSKADEPGLPRFSAQRGQLLHGSLRVARGVVPVL